MLNLEAHRLALAIAKKMLDENHFKTTQKTMDRTPPSFKIGDKSIFQEQAAWQMGSQVETWIQNCPNWGNGHFLHIKKPGNRKSMILQDEGCGT